MRRLPASKLILDRNRQFIAGGTFLLNRETDPVAVLEKGQPNIFGPNRELLQQQRTRQRLTKQAQ
jgi:hypothetical protein